MRFGLILKYKQYDLYKGSNIQRIFEIIDDVNPLLEFPFIKYKTMSRDSHAKVYNKVKNLNPIGKKELIDDCVVRKYDVVTFYNGDIDKEPPSVFDIDLDKHDDFTNPIRKIEFILENTSSVDDNVISTLIVKLSGLINYWYGYIIISDLDYNSFHSQTSWMPINVWDPSKGFLQTDQQKELGFYQKNSDKLDHFIAKAYWGNMLNRNHVETLGGYDRVKKEAPAYLVEKLQGGGVYIQLTQSPNDFQKKDFVEKLISLDNYFEPIILPERPEVVW